MEKKKKKVELERKEKQLKEQNESIPAKLRHLKKSTNLKKSGSLSLDKIETQDAISVGKLDLYSRNILWHEKKKQRILESQHEKQMNTLNKSLEDAVLRVGSHLKPSVA